MTALKLGIWMDHSNANLIEFTDGGIITKVLNSDFTHQDKSNALNRSEQQMHNREQHQQHGYYAQLGEIIRRYSHVLLFGPTDAKVELFNLLHADHRYAAIRIDVEQADKMTDNQQHAFVRKHFEQHHLPG
jgi:hypothetical protein